MGDGFCHDYSPSDQEQARGRNQALIVEGLAGLYGGKVNVTGPETAACLFAPFQLPTNGLCARLHAGIQPWRIPALTLENYHGWRDS